MGDYYRINEYPKKLVDVKSFPIRGGLIYLFLDYPNAISDGFMLDLNANNKDLRKCSNKEPKQYKPNFIISLLEHREGYKYKLSEPEYIFESVVGPAYIMFSNNIPMSIQVKYHKYFRYRYQECKFYTNNDLFLPLLVIKDDKLVGSVMPMILGVKSREDIEDMIARNDNGE